jgi:hypothetical protein
VDVSRKIRMLLGLFSTHCNKKEGLSLSAESNI